MPAMHQAMHEPEPLPPQTPASPHVVGNQPDLLRRILEPGVNLSLWQRPAPGQIAGELETLDASDLPDLRCTTSPDSFADDVCALLRERSLDPSRFAHWRRDLARLAALYFAVSPGRSVTLRLETTGDDGCRRFHVDRTRLRLLCTYRGPGTEWLSDAQVDRAAQASGAPNDGMVRFGAPSRFEPFWVGILKGDAYPGNAGHGLVHRSPAIAGTGQTRVLFCLDC